MDPVTMSPHPRNVRLYRVPLIPVAAAFVGGILAGRYAVLPIGLWALVGLAGVVLACATLFRRHLHFPAACGVAAAIFAIGAVHAHQAYYTHADDHIVTYSGDRAILATIRGQVVTVPQRIEDDRSAGYPQGPRTTFALAAGAIRTSAGWEGVSGLLGVTVQQADDRLAAGQEIELCGRLGRLRGPDNPGQYDWSAAGRRNGVFNWFRVPAADGVTILRGRYQPWYARALWRVRAAARQHVASCGDESQGRLMNALITGQRHPHLGRLNQTMFRAGIAHFLSISGLHLGVFLGFVFLLCRAAALSPRKAAVVVLAVMGAYLLLAEPRSPLLRSAIMAAALCLSVIWRRRYFALNALSAAAICLLAFDPMELFTPGFQLSFTIVAGLLVLHGPLHNVLFGRWVRRRGLMVFRGQRRITRWFHYTAANWLMNLAAMSVTAYLVAAPLAAYHFGLFSPYGAVLTALLFPLVLAVLVPGYVSMALAWPMPNLSYAVGRLSAAAAETLSSAVDALESLPALSVALRPVGEWWVLLCYAAVLLILLRRGIRFGRGFAIAAVVAVALATAYSQRTAPKPDAAELNILSVGAGQCAVLRTPSGRVYVLDAGSLGRRDVHAQVLAPFLRNRRLPAPREAFVSHANIDHFNALGGVLRSGRVERVFLNDYFGRDPCGSDRESPARELAGELARRNITTVRLHAGQRIVLDDRTYVDVLWPPQQRRDDLCVNDTSLVLCITCDDKRVLLTGDIEALAQRELTPRSEAIRADVLLMPHHGSWERTLPDFVRSAGPHFVLVSNSHEPYAPVGATSRRNRFLRRLKSSYRYYSTSRNGWIQVRFGRGKVEVETMR